MKLDNAAIIPEVSFKCKGAEVSCNLCGSERRELLTFSIYNEYKNYKILCKDCGLIYTNPILNIKELSEFYEYKYYKREKIFNPQLKRIYKATLRSLYRYNRIKYHLTVNSHILDASACMGEFIYILKHKGYSSIGVEHNPHFIKYAHEEFEIKLENHFLDKINFPKSSFDVIMAYHILDLYINPAKVLNKYHSFLKDGGILNIEVSNLEFAHIQAQALPNLKRLYFFSLETIEKLMRKTGFEIVNTILIPGSMHINMILKKTTHETTQTKSKEDYLKVKGLLRHNQALEFLTKPLTYITNINNIKKYVNTNLAANRYISGRELLDDCLQRNTSF